MTSELVKVYYDIKPLKYLAKLHCKLSRLSDGVACQTTVFSPCVCREY